MFSVVPHAVPVPEPPPIAPIIVKADTSTTKGIKQRIHYYAELYGVSEITLLNVTHCESNFNPNAIGDGGRSFGLAQIHLPAHPQISKEEALDPEFAIEFMAKNIKTGNGNMWTCWRMN